jgi:hypothetical protein
MATSSFIRYSLHEVLMWAIIRLRKKTSVAGGIYNEGHFCLIGQLLTLHNCLVAMVIVNMAAVEEECSFRIASLKVQI